MAHCWRARRGQGPRWQPPWMAQSSDSECRGKPLEIADLVSPVSARVNGSRERCS